MKTKNYTAITRPLTAAALAALAAGPAPARTPFQLAAQRGEVAGVGIGEEYKEYTLTVEAGVRGPVVAVRSPHFPKVVLSVWADARLAKREVDRLDRITNPISQPDAERAVERKPRPASIGSAGMAGAFAAVGL